MPQLNNQTYLQDLDCRDVKQLSKKLDSLSLDESVSAKLSSLHTIRESMLWPRGYGEERQIIDSLPKGTDFYLNMPEIYVLSEEVQHSSLQH